MRLQRCLGRKGAHDECGSGQGAVLPKGRDGGSQSRYWTPRREVGYMRTGVGSYGGTGWAADLAVSGAEALGLPAGRPFHRNPPCAECSAPTPHFPGQRVCREASAGVVDELQHSIEVMCPEDRQSVILCIDEVVNCDVPDQPSAYSADRSADGSLRSGLWWRSSSETGGEAR